MTALTEDSFFPLVVTLCIDVLEPNKENFSKHLDHHLKSDNWTKYLESNPIYLKDNYFVDYPKDFELTKEDFAKDLQALFDVSTSQLIKYCSCEEPIQGIAQLGNLGHVTFNINFDIATKKFTVLCLGLSSYGDSPDLFEMYEKV